MAKERKERFDWGDFFAESWWWFLIPGWVIFGGIEGIIEAKKPDVPLQPAVVIEMNQGYKSDKIRFFDGVSAIEHLDDMISVGDTISVKRK